MAYYPDTKYRLTITRPGSLAESKLTHIIEGRTPLENRTVAAERAREYAADGCDVQVTRLRWEETELPEGWYPAKKAST